MQVNNKDILKFIPNGVKILIFDIETAPNLAYVWGMWKQNISADKIVRKSHMLSWAAKWAGQEQMFSDHNMNYGDDPFDDRGTVTTLHRLLDNADIVVGYNSKNFDVKVFNGRCIELGLEPPSPYKQVDLFHVVKANFNIPHKGLNAIAKHLGVEQKMQHSGFQLWVDCMAGDLDAWDTMVRYNQQDIVVTEEVYRILRPWIKNHPNLGAFMQTEEPVCPKCGGNHIHFRGYAHTNVSKFRRFQCMNCGGWGRIRLAEKTQKRPITVNEV